jgi:hypothetical protein
MKAGKQNPKEILPRRRGGTEENKRDGVFGFKPKMHLNSVPLLLSELK